MISYIYVMESAGHFKVGFSISPAARLATLRVASPLPITIVESFEVPALHARKIEGYAHKLLRKCHIRKRGEWFWTTASQATAAVKTAIRFHYKPEEREELARLEELGPPVYEDGCRMPYFSAEARAYRDRVAALKKVCG